jgi:uncharacterized damage-inducible protein DinB
MNEIERILDQMTRSFERESWHGPAVLEALAGVTMAQALRRPLMDAHTIWELVLHMSAWKAIVRRRLLAERVDVTPEIDWPPVGDFHENEWNAAIERLKREHDALREVVAAFDPGRLGEVRSDGHTAYVLIHGVIQHDLWHAGQIVLLRRGTG